MDLFKKSTLRIGCLGTILSSILLVIGMTMVHNSWGQERLMSIEEYNDPLGKYNIGGYLMNLGFLWWGFIFIYVIYSLIKELWKSLD